MQHLGVLGSIGKSVARVAAKPLVQPQQEVQVPVAAPVAEVVVPAVPEPEPEPFLSVSESVPPVTQSTSPDEQEAVDAEIATEELASA